MLKIGTTAILAIVMTAAFAGAQSVSNSPASKPTSRPAGASSQPAATSASAKRPTSQPASQPIVKTASWLTSFAQACKQAKASNKIILADFTGSDWCIWCKRLKKEVFDTKEFQNWAVQNVILLEVDFPRKPQDDATRKQNAELAGKYGIRGYPTILFLSSDGQVIGKSGYMEGGSKGWVANADRIIGKTKATKP